MVGTRLNISHEEDNCLELIATVVNALLNATISTTLTDSTTTTFVSKQKDNGRVSQHRNEISLVLMMKK